MDVLQFKVSNADFDDLPGQFEDAVLFLTEHEADVARLVAAGDAVLDFGYAPRDVDVQYDRLPRELVRRAAALDVQIELSLYLFRASDEDETAQADEE